MSLRTQLGNLEDLSSLSTFFSGFANGKEDDWTSSAWEWPVDEGETTADFELNGLLVSVAPTAEAMVFAKAEKICIYSIKLNARDSSKAFQQSFKGKVVNTNSGSEEAVTAVSCIPVASMQKSAFGLTDWICFVVGTASGNVYFYTETGKVLLCQQFHDSSVQSIRCKTSEKAVVSTFNVSAEEVIIVYEKEIVCLEVFGLFQTLKACRNQLAGVQSSSIYEIFQPPPLSYKKWGLSGQRSISDAVSVGMTVTNSFDHLVTASTQGGFTASVYGSPPLFYLYAACGNEPFLAFHYGQEGMSNFVLSQVAKDLAGKVTSAIFSAAGSWLGRPAKVEQKPKPKIEAPTPANCRFTLDDPLRGGLSISLSPDSSLVATTDSLGRVILADVSRGQIVRMWKGYRNAECGWIQARSDAKSVLYLVIHVPKRGLLEVWLAQNGQRICATNVPPHGRLIYPGYSVVGMLRAEDSPVTSPVHQVFYLSPDGSLSSVDVSYEQAIVCMSNVKTRDVQLLERVKKILGRLVSEEELLEALNSLKNSDSLSKALSLVLSCDAVNAELLEKVLDLYCAKCNDEMCDSQGRLLLHECERIKGLVKLYIDINKQSMSQNPTDFDDDFASVLIGGVAEQEIIGDLKAEKASQSAADLQSSMSVIEFASCFESCSGPEHRRSSCMKNNLSNEKKVQLSSSLLQGLFSLNSCETNFLHPILDSGVTIDTTLEIILTYWFSGKQKTALNLVRTLVDVVKYFLCVSEKRASFLKLIEARVKASTNVIDAIVLALCVRHVLKEPVAEAKDEIESERSGVESSKSEEWEDFSVNYVEWDMLVGILVDVYYLHQLVKSEPSLELSVEQLELKGKGSVSDVVAQYLVRINCDAAAVLKQLNDDNDAADGLDLQKSLKKLKEALPFSLDSQRLLCLCSIEFVSAWAKNKDDTEKLSKALACLSALDNAYCRHGSAKIIWSTFVCSHFSVIATLADEAGRIPNDSKYSALAASGRHIPKFVKFCEQLLETCVEAGTHLATERLPFFKYDSIFKNGRTPIFETAVHQRSVNIDLALLHQELCTTLLLMARFDLRNVKVLSLFDQDSKTAFFKELSSYPVLPSGEPSYTITARRIQFLKKAITSLAKDLVDKRKRSKWMRKCLDLAKSWRCYDDEFKLAVIEILFSLSFDEEAYELSLAVSNLHGVGKILLRTAAERLNCHLVKSEMTAYFLSVLQPKISSWLQRQAESPVATSPSDISALLSKAASLLSSDTFEYEACLTLNQAVKEVLE